MLAVSYIGVGHGRKYGGSRRNRFAICFRSKVISTSGLMAGVLNFGRRTMSDNVRRDKFKPDVIDNVRVAVGITTSTFAVQKLFLLPVSLAAILNFGSLSSSTNVDHRLEIDM